MRISNLAVRRSLFAAGFFTAGAAFAGAVGSIARSAENPMLRPADEGPYRLQTAAAAMRQRAADPAQAAAMADEVAEQMVIDHMAAALAAEPRCKRACVDAMADPAVVAVHAAAKKMADDPAQSPRFERRVLDDATAVSVVAHRAMQMSTETADESKRK